MKTENSASPLPMKDWLAPSSMHFLVKNKTNIPGRLVVVGIENRLFREMLSRTFEPASRDSYLLLVQAPHEFSRHMYGGTYREDELKACEKEIYPHEQLLNEFLDQQTSEMLERLKKVGQDPDSFERHLVQLEAKVVTNLMNGFLSMYQKADYLYTLHNSLWLLGELADKAEEANDIQRAYERTLREQMYGYSRALGEQTQKIQRLMSALHHERSQYRAAQSEHTKKVLEENEDGTAVRGKVDTTTPEREAAFADRAELSKKLPTLKKQLEEAVKSKQKPGHLEAA